MKGSTAHKKTPAMLKNVGIDGADKSLEERQRNYRDRESRLCDEQREISQKLLQGYTKLGVTEYIKRHVLKILAIEWGKKDLTVKKASR